VLNVLIQLDKGQLLSHFAVIVSFADYAPLVDLVRVDKVGKTQKRLQLLLLNLYCKIALPLLPISIIELLAQSNLHLDIRVYLFLLTFEKIFEAKLETYSYAEIFDYILFGAFLAGKFILHKVLDLLLY